MPATGFFVGARSSAGTLAGILVMATASAASLAVCSNHASAQVGGHWSAIVAEDGAVAGFGWRHPAYEPEPAGPFLGCVEPGKQVTLVVLADGVREGQSPKLRFSRGAETVELSGHVGPDEESASAMIGPSHPVYALFRGTGTLTVQVGNRPKDTYSLKTAPAAFATFAKACRLSS